MRRGWGNLGLFSRVPGVPGAAIWAPARAQGLSRSPPSSPQRHPQVSKYVFVICQCVCLSSPSHPQGSTEPPHGVPRNSDVSPRGPNDRCPKCGPRGLPGSLPGTALGSPGGPMGPPGESRRIPGPPSWSPGDPGEPPRSPQSPRVSKCVVFTRKGDVFHNSQNRSQGFSEAPPRLHCDLPRDPRGSLGHHPRDPRRSPRDPE